ncbi:MAG: FN3 associated domain-containing protein [Opitutales bacterium]
MMKTPSTAVWLGLTTLAASLSLAETAPIITEARLYPAAGQAALLVGGDIVGSNQGETIGFVELASVDATPDEGQWVTLRFANSTRYRWVKYEAPEGAHGIVAEVAFFDSDGRQVSGKQFGTAGNRSKGSHYAAALDGDTATFFDAPLADGAYVGLDLATEANQAAPVTIEAVADPGGTQGAIRLSTDTPGATIRYTLDGSLPTLTHGKSYDRHFFVDEGMHRIRAVAFRDQLFPSNLAGETFTVGEAGEQRGLRTFHIGNSLTDTTNGWLEPMAQSAGYDHRYHRFTIPGAPTDWLWNHPNSGFGESNVAKAFPRLAPIDAIIQQPFAGHGRTVANEAEHGGKFWQLARETSPDVRLWVYQQWPTWNFGDRWAKANFADQALKAQTLAPATTWEEAVMNHLAYNERLRETLDQAHDGPPVGIIPVGLALKNLKEAIDAGRVPGFAGQDFHALHFPKEGKDIHVNNRGAYFVNLVFFSTLYGVPPEAVNLPAERIDLTPEQDRIYRQIAWDTVRNYPWAR